jgi:hypothetical protein
MYSWMKCHSFMVQNWNSIEFFGKQTDLTHKLHLLRSKQSEMGNVNIRSIDRHVFSKHGVSSVDERDDLQWTFWSPRRSSGFRGDILLRTARNTVTSKLVCSWEQPEQLTVTWRKKWRLHMHVCLTCDYEFFFHFSFIIHMCIQGLVHFVFFSNRNFSN